MTGGGVRPTAISETFWKGGNMSLFSSTDPKTLTPTHIKTAPLNGSHESTAVFRLVSFSVLLSLLMALTVISIFVVRLRPVPSFPGTHTDDSGSMPRFVQALDTLHDNSDNACSISVSKGGEHYDSSL